MSGAFLAIKENPRYIQLCEFYQVQLWRLRVLKYYWRQANTAAEERDAELPDFVWQAAPAVKVITWLAVRLWPFARRLVPAFVGLFSLLFATVIHTSTTGLVGPSFDRIKVSVGLGFSTTHGGAVNISIPGLPTAHADFVPGNWFPIDINMASKQGLSHLVTNVNVHSIGGIFKQLATDPLHFDPFKVVGIESALALANAQVMWIAGLTLLFAMTFWLTTGTFAHRRSQRSLAIETGYQPDENEDAVTGTSRLRVITRIIWTSIRQTYRSLKAMFFLLLALIMWGYFSHFVWPAMKGGLHVLSHFL